MPRLAVVRDDIRARRDALAQRYAAWLDGAIQQSGWEPAEVARRSGLPKQKISEILQGRAPQPTAAQIAGFARAFHLQPGDILGALGLWAPPPGGLPTYRELEREYGALSFPGRRVVMQTARGIRELEQWYRTEGEEPDQPKGPVPFTPLPGEPSAALHNERGEIVTEDNAPDPPREDDE